MKKSRFIKRDHPLKSPTQWYREAITKMLMVGETWLQIAALWSVTASCRKVGTRLWFVRGQVGEL